MLPIVFMNRDEDTSSIEEDVIQKDTSPKLNLTGGPKASTVPGITGKGDLSQKATYRAISPELLRDTALGFTFGQNKHGVDNFRKMTPEAAGEVWNALMRHLEAYRLKETHATDSGIHHLAHVVCNLSMLYRILSIHGDEAVLNYINGGD